ncbi:isoamyl acetate-hydrolyzing esterase 1 homolog [Astatotilapia calliptera]|uniref:isoamyl acetate-hydrolyzing esterase 1 homolog n=1 Tax=Astatotilapia calliptera TaxID=8154 RepID=UPI000E418458|nr:isoamyl acetate-hydrolyzing esterase 1 homolog [Astatotilapia calliptera]
MSKFTSIIWPKVILFGDSITQVSFQPNGWGAEIADKLARKCDVINRGLSGYNSRWGKIVLPRLINPENSADSKIEAVTIFFGANDSALEGTASLEHAHSCYNLTNTCTLAVIYTRGVKHKAWRARIGLTEIPFTGHFIRYGLLVPL